MKTTIGIATLLLVTPTNSAIAQEVAEYDPHVQVVAAASPPSLTLKWQTMPNAASFSIARRATGTTEWQMLQASLPSSTTNFADSSVLPKKTFEYRVSRSGNDGSNGAGYVLAGIDVPFPDDQGVIAIVVTTSSLAGYGDRLARLESDLRAEGWQVMRAEVDAADSPPAVRARLVALQGMLAGRLKAALLLGPVPQPYSGFLNPDGHPEHRGAWPADAYYSDLDGVWTDEKDFGGSNSGAIEGSKGRQEPLKNMAGDGKFDQEEIPSDLDIAVGRIDARDMPGFSPLTATDLENHYLDNNHAFRTGEVTFGRRTSVTDLLHIFNGVPLARMAYRDGTAVFGSEPQDVGAQGSFFTALEKPEGFGLSFTISYGHVDGSAALGDNVPFKNHKARAFFYGAFGSFFGDWVTTDNVLREAIFHPGIILGSNWCNWPDNHYHQLGALWTIGATLLPSFNNDLQDQTRSARGKHSGLMGDPTLRLFVTKAPSALVATPGAAGAALAWQPSLSSGIVGYHVYRGPIDGMGAPERVTAAPVTETSYLDSTAQPGVPYQYRVVAVEHVQTGSGTFFNHSPGSIVSTEGTPSSGGAGAGGKAAAGGASMTTAAGSGNVTPMGVSGSESGGSGAQNPATPATSDNGESSCGCRLPQRAPVNGAPLALAVGLLTVIGRRRRRPLVRHTHGEKV